MTGSLGLAIVIFTLAAVASILHAKHAMKTSTSVVGAVCWALIDLAVATGSAIGVVTILLVMLLK